MSQQQQSNKQQAITVAGKSLEEALAKHRIEHIAKLPEIEQAFAIGRGIQELRKILTDDVVRELIMPLQGSALGFRTDKDSSGGYPIDVVRECALEALIRGFRLTGNEFNIIGRNFYGAQSGFERLVAQFPGLSDLELMPGVPFMKDSAALVPYYGTWKINGEVMKLERQLVKDGDTVLRDERIPVRVNNGMGVDAVLGKAKRKFLAHIYERLLGMKLGLVDGEVTDTEGVDVTNRPAPSSAVAQATGGKRLSLRGKSHALPPHDEKTGEVTEKAEPTGDPEPRVREPGEEG